MATERSILRELTDKTLTAYLKARQYSTFLFETYFPFKTVSQLDYTTLIGDAGTAVAADVVSYDSSAPLKSRKVISKLTGSIPAVRIARFMNEKDILDYNYLKGLADAIEKTALVELVFNDVDFCYEGVMARLEWLALQAMSLGQISLSKSNNAGIITENVVDFQVPSGNKKGVAVVWSASASTTTPLTDFRAMQTVATANGHKLLYALMRPEQFNYFRASTEVKNEIGYYLIGTSALPKSPNLATVNDYLLGEGLPTIRIIDQMITTETIGQSQTTANPWSLGKVAFLPADRLGNTLSAPLAARISPPQFEIQAMRGNVLIAKWRETNPVNEWTRGEINAFPSLNEAHRVYLMNTENVSTWS